MRLDSQSASVKSEISQIAKGAKSADGEIEFSQNSEGHIYKERVTKVLWRLAQILGCVAYLFFGVAILNMIFSEDVASVIRQGKTLPAHLQGCETLTFATKYGEAVCSKFPSIKSSPYIFTAYVALIFVTHLFLSYSGKKNRGWKFTKIS